MCCFYKKKRVIFLQYIITSLEVIDLAPSLSKATEKHVIPKM